MSCQFSIIFLQPPSAWTQAEEDPKSYPSQVFRVPADCSSENHLFEIWDVKQLDKPLFSGTAEDRHKGIGREQDEDLGFGQ